MLNDLFTTGMQYRCLYMQGKKRKKQGREKNQAPRQNCHICFRKYRQNTDDRVKREKSLRHLYFNVVNK